ncbi:MAG: 30S ribosomal protein S16 [Prosthecobacter sp.]|uniref:30S ribosomal protein S16 n=1 Tax=Prosthecobacter sp. TaxID=1965333 RepID=UPI0039044FF9
MAVVIRLRQEGAKGRPVFRIVAADQRFPKEGRFLEILGTYDPQKGIKSATLKLDRVNAWIAQGAKPSDTVASIIKHAPVTATA